MPKLHIMTNLQTFHTIDDLDAMWNIMRSELSRRIGGKHLICLPHITDGNCYNVGGVLIKTQEKGWLCTKKRTFLPLGPLENLIDKESSSEYWDSHHPLLFSKTKSIELKGYCKISKRDAILNEGLARSGFTILLEDNFSHKELKLNVESIHTRSLPPEINPVNTIVFDRSKHPELANVQEIYIVTNVKEVDRLELTGVIGTHARIFHIIKRYPLYFTYQKYKLDEGGKVIAKIRGNPSQKRTTWVRNNKTERIIDDITQPDLNTIE